MTPPPLRLKMEGLVLIAMLIGICYLLLEPRVSGILGSREALQRSNERISEYTERLAAPPLADRFGSYRKFVTQSSPDTDPNAMSGALQAAIIEHVKARKGRLIDLRETSSPTRIDGLVPISLRLEVEGDIQTGLETIADMDGLPYPVLIEALDFRPATEGFPAETRMRLVLILTSWTGDLE